LCKAGLVLYMLADVISVARQRVTHHMEIIRPDPPDSARPPGA
jgi:2-phospho-L-lactate guanylyltransferase (CobY/MobA/RfbA family)